MTAETQPAATGEPVTDETEPATAAGEPAMPTAGPAPDDDPGEHPPSAQPLEVELKYRMSDVATGQRLLAADDLGGFAAVGPIETVRHDDRYVDTPDGALAGAGYAGRLRSSAGGTVITLKSLDRYDTGGALHRRRELEGPADPVAPIAGWPASVARDALAAIVGDRGLIELVTLRQTRHRRQFARDGAGVEVSADDVEVLVGGRVVERFAELELELREGDEVALEPLVERLAEHEELVSVEASKLERALDAVRRDRPAGAEEPGAPAMATGPRTVTPAAPRSRRAPVAFPVGPLPDDVPGTTATGVPGVAPADAGTAPSAAPPEANDDATSEAPAAVAPAAVAPSSPVEPEAPRILVPKSPGVLADDHLAEAGRKVLRFHLARMVAREAGAREGASAEELHGMRVATRRQRAAWRVFGDAFEPRRTRRYRRRLRRVASDLGAVRDLDVLIDAVDTYRDGLPSLEAQSLEPLIAAWQDRRETARAVLVRELDSGGYQRWLDDYLAFAQAEGQAVHNVAPTEPHRVRDTMPSRIWAAHQGVRAYEPVMRWADVTTLHELRIAAKWLRYTLEFMREVLGRDAGPVIEKIVALQDHLGWLHDADVAAGLARAFLVEHAGDLTELESAAIGRYLVDRERELARLRRTVGPPWRGVSSLAFRRALGRLVAGM